MTGLCPLADSRTAAVSPTMSQCDGPWMSEPCGMFVSNFDIASSRMCVRESVFFINYLGLTAIMLDGPIRKSSATFSSARRSSDAGCLSFSGFKLAKRQFMSEFAPSVVGVQQFVTVKISGRGRPELENPKDKCVDGAIVHELLGVNDIMFVGPIRKSSAIESSTPSSSNAG